MPRNNRTYESSAALRFNDEGNHELDFDTEYLRTLIGQADFLILAINIRERETGKLFARHYVIQQLGSPLK